MITLNILVIGNGFDLAHELPTTYMDFFTFIVVIKDKLEPSNKINFKYFKKKETIEQYIYKYLFINKYNSDISKKCNHLIKELKNLIFNNFWIDYFLKNIIPKCKDKGWIDFETEISKVIKLLHNNKEELFKKGFTENKNIINVCKILNMDILINQNHIKDRININNEIFFNIIKKLENDLDKLIRCLEIYLTSLVEKLECNIAASYILDKNITKVLSFNYTNTYEKLYDLDNNIQYHYIHGKAHINGSLSKNNMILGIDEYLDESKKNLELDFIRFKKYFQRIYKQTGSLYKKWLSETTPLTISDNNVYILGHSLDITDKDVLQELIQHDFTKITIFYHTKEAYAQQICNLVKIIGCDKLIEYVSEPNKKITFTQIP